MPDQPTRTCLTCKHEPEWNAWNAGYCKLIPEFLRQKRINKDRFIVSIYKNEIVSNGHGERSTYYKFIITDCNLWEAKEPGEETVMKACEIICDAMKDVLMGKDNEND